MASIVEYEKQSRRTGKTFRGYRAFIRRTINGKSVGQSKVFATRREADQWARENETPDAVKKLAGQVQATGTFAELVTLVRVAHPAKGWKFADPDHLDWWAMKLGHLRPREIDHGILNQLKAELQVKPAMRRGKAGAKPTGKPISTATANRYLASLSSVFNFALSREIIDRHPMKAGGVTKEQELNQRTRTLTAEEEQRLYDAAEASSWPLLKLFLRVCLTTGCRRSEALRLKWTDLQLDQSHALLRRTKNGNPLVRIGGYGGNVLAASAFERKSTREREAATRIYAFSWDADSMMRRGDRSPMYSCAGAESIHHLQIALRGKGLIPAVGDESKLVADAFAFERALGGGPRRL